jgi:hypothetical protein
VVSRPKSANNFAPAHSERSIKYRKPSSVDARVAGQIKWHRHLGALPQEVKFVKRLSYTRMIIKHDEDSRMTSQPGNRDLLGAGGEQEENWQFGLWARVRRNLKVLTRGNLQVSAHLEPTRHRIRQEAFNA